MNLGFRKANATLIARTMVAETAAYQAGHPKVSMTRKHYVEEYKEAIDTRAVLIAFDAASSGAQAPTQARPAADRGESRVSSRPESAKGSDLRH
jgi:hypothetical protein